MSEDYYFNPKLVKRAQVSLQCSHQFLFQIMRLIDKLKQNGGRAQGKEIRPGVTEKERNTADAHEQTNQTESRKKNFFERKRFVNYQQPGEQPIADEEDSDHNEKPLTIAEQRAKMEAQQQ